VKKTKAEPTPVAPDAAVLTCLECSKQVVGLSLHLKYKHKLTPTEYKKKHGLPEDYPMMAPGRPRKSKMPRTGTDVVPYRKPHQELILRIALQIVYDPDIISQINKVLMQSGIGRVLEGALKNAPPIIQVYKGK
jgi:hypothetical protein